MSNDISKGQGMQHALTVPPALQLPCPPIMPKAPQMPSAPVSVAPPPPFIDWVCGAELHGEPPKREWLVPGMIPLGTVTLLYGDGGTGKSLIALQLAVSTVIGRLWLNKQTLAGPVIYFSAEDDRDELHRRVSDICTMALAKSSDLAMLHIADMAGKDSLLASVGRKTGQMNATMVLEKLDEHASTIRPKLVVLDTLADMFPGNENDRSQVRQFIGLVRGLAIRHRCAVVILAHPSLSGIATGNGASGSTAWNNSVRSRLYFERVKSDGYESDPDLRRLKVMKANYGSVGEEISVRWKDGVFVAQDSPIASENDAKAEKTVLDLIDSNAAKGRYFSAMRAPGELATMPGNGGLSKGMLKRAMERLLAAEKLTQRTIRENRRDRTIVTTP